MLWIQETYYATFVFDPQRNQRWDNLQIANVVACGCDTWVLSQGLGFEFTETNLDPFEANWIVELDPASDPSNILGSWNHEFPLSFVLSSEPIDFPSTIGAM
jgi:hypothetical protein